MYRTGKTKTLKSGDWQPDFNCEEPSDEEVYEVMLSLAQRLKLARRRHPVSFKFEGIKGERRKLKRNPEKKRAYATKYQLENWKWEWAIYKHLKAERLEIFCEEYSYGDGWEDPQTGKYQEWKEYQPEHLKATTKMFDWLREAHGATPKPSEPNKPSWQKERRSLCLGKNTIATYEKHPAKNQTRVLEAFEEEDWAECIDSPISGSNDKKKLRDTIRSLNKKQNVLGFRADGTGEKICWSLNSETGLSGDV